MVTHATTSTSQPSRSVASEAIRPRRPAPARFGAAGFSADGRSRVKTSITLKRGPLVPQQDIEGIGTISDYDSLGQNLARGLAGLSLALGVAELAAAGRIADHLGMRDKEMILRMHGVREIGQGIGILSTNRPRDRAAWLWVRVAGDALDLATLASGLSRKNVHRKRVGWAMAAIAGVTAIDALCAMILTSKGPKPQPQWEGSSRYEEALQSGTIA